MNKLIDKKAKIIFFITLCSALLIVHAFVHFGISISKMELSNTQEDLEEMAESSIREVRKKYEDMIFSLQEMTNAFQRMPSVEDAQVYEQLAFLKSVTVFDFIGIADKNAVSYTHLDVYKRQGFGWPVKRSKRNRS